MPYWCGSRTGEEHVEVKNVYPVSLYLYPGRVGFFSNARKTKRAISLVTPCHQRTATEAVSRIEELARGLVKKDERERTLDGADGVEDICIWLVKKGKQLRAIVPVDMAAIDLPGLAVPAEDRAGGCVLEWLGGNGGAPQRENRRGEGQDRVGEAGLDVADVVRSAFV